MDNPASYTIKLPLNVDCYSRFVRSWFLALNEIDKEKALDVLAKECHSHYFLFLFGEWFADNGVDINAVAATANINGVDCAHRFLFAEFDCARTAILFKLTWGGA